MHHFGEDGILELLHFGEDGFYLFVVVGHIYFRCKSKMYSLLLLLHHSNLQLQINLGSNILDWCSSN